MYLYRQTLKLEVENCNFNKEAALSLLKAVSSRQLSLEIEWVILLMYITPLNLLCKS